jgi:hypothetical protein
MVESEPKSSGFFIDVSEWIVHNPPASHYGVAVSDVDGDGRYEFLVARFDGANRLLRWSGTQLRDVAPPAFEDVEQASLAIAAGDVDGDGREEIYVHNSERFQRKQTSTGSPLGHPARRSMGRLVHPSGACRPPE